MRENPPGDLDAYLDRVPVRAVEWEEKDGQVRLLVPRYGRGALGRFLERVLKPRPFRVRLDERGSEVWRRCDGRTRASEIARSLAARPGEGPDARERLAVFLHRLQRGRFIRWARPDRIGEERADDLSRGPAADPQDAGRVSAGATGPGLRTRRSGSPWRVSAPS